MVNAKNLVDHIIEYENGNMVEYETLELFSYLVKSGQAWTLQGHYGRVATHLIDNGYLDKKGRILENV